MESVADIITAFGGPTKFGEAIGVSAQAATNMRARNSIDPAHWTRIVAEAANRSIEGLTLEALAKIHERKTEAAA